MTEQTRHVTLMVTHPGGAGHLTLDHHIPVEAAEELVEMVRMVRAVHVPGGGRAVTVFRTRADGWTDLITRDTDDATADRVIAAMAEHMPERTERAEAAIARERTAIAKGVREYFATADDPLCEDARILSGRIERGEYGWRDES